MDEMKKRGATPNKSLFRRIAESEFFHNYKRSPSAIVGTVIVVLVLFIALFGPLFAPQNPYDVASLSLTDSYKPPAWEAGGDARFIFGTDSQGRDIFSSLIYGSRISLFIGVVGTLLACAVGITLGLISGYFGGRVDAVIMRLADILLSFPDILVALFIMTMFGRGVSKLLVVFTIIGCVTYVRTVRAEVLTVKQMEYVDAARVIGIPNILIIAKHVLPKRNDNRHRYFHDEGGRPYSGGSHAELSGRRRSGHGTLSGHAGQERLRRAVQRILVDRGDAGSLHHADRVWNQSFGRFPAR